MSQGKALLLAGVALLAFGSAADAATEVRVIVSHYSDQTGPIFEAMAEEFEAANPDIDIVIEDVAWGALHGLLLLIAHGWRHLVHRRRSSLRPVAGSGEARARRWSRPIAHVAGVALTFACVHLAWVLFRAESFAAALSVYGGMLGLNGVRLPEYYLDMLGSWGPILQARGVSFAPLRDFAFGGMEQIAITALAALLVFFAPTTQRLFGLAGDPCGSSSTTSAPGIVRPNFSWGLTTGVALAVVISTLLSDPPDVFIYFLF